MRRQADPTPAGSVRPVRRIGRRVLAEVDPAGARSPPFRLSSSQNAGFSNGEAESAPLCTAPPVPDQGWRATHCSACAPQDSAKACCSTRRQCARPLGRRGFVVADDRQHLVPPAVLGVARPLQHHPLGRPADLVEAGCRLAAPVGAVGFGMGPSDCRWIDRLEGAHGHRLGRWPRASTRRWQWRIAVAGVPCRFLVFGGLVLGEREVITMPGRVEIDAVADKRRDRVRPDPASLWGQRSIRTRSTISSPCTPGRGRGDRRGRSALHRRPSRAAAASWRSGRTRRLDVSTSPSSASLAIGPGAERLAVKYARRVKLEDACEPRGPPRGTGATLLAICA